VTGVMVWVGVAALGGAGAVARFLVGVAVSERARHVPAIGTLVVNLSGAFALGVLSGTHVGGNSLLLAGTALLGSYTTFSTWMLESHQLGEDGARGALAANLSVSLAAGLAAVALGRVLGGAF